MVREFLKKLDLPLWRLRERVGRPDKLFPSGGKADGLTDVWFERIGLGPADVTALLDTDWWVLYGYANSAAALADLANAKTLSRRLGVSYTELVELIKIGFMNPEIDNLVVLHRLGLEPHDLDRCLKDDKTLTDPEKSAFPPPLTKLGLSADDLPPPWP